MMYPIFSDGITVASTIFWVESKAFVSSTLSRLFASCLPGTAGETVTVFSSKRMAPWGTDALFLESLILSGITAKERSDFSSLIASHFTVTSPARLLLNLISEAFELSNSPVSVSPFVRVNTSLISGLFTSADFLPFTTTPCATPSEVVSSTKEAAVDRHTIMTYMDGHSHHRTSKSQGLAH